MSTYLQYVFQIEIMQGIMMETILILYYMPLENVYIKRQFINDRVK